MANEEEKKTGKKEHTLLNSKLGGGPHGLGEILFEFPAGDPDDMHLRKVEKDILIAKLVRDRAREEKCIPEVEAFTECCKESKFMMIFTCQKQNSDLKECLTHWYKNEKFWDECTKQYLKDRSNFRRTGEPKKIRDFKARMASNF